MPYRLALSGRHHRAGIALLCLLSVCVVSAAPVGPSTVRPAGSIDSESVDPARLVLPFDEYKLSSQEVTTLEQAHRLLVQRCMHELGLDFSMPANPGATRSQTDIANSRRYGVADENTARRFGYHFPADRDGDRRLRQLHDWESGLSENELTAIYGAVDKPGCFDQADADLSQGTLSVDTGWLTSQDFRSVDESVKDDAVVRAQVEWRECMSYLDFNYNSPLAAISDPQWNLDSPEITSRERETALADVHCKRTSHLVGTWYEAEVALQRQIIEGDQARFNTFAVNNQVRLSNARRVLSG